MSKEASKELAADIANQKSVNQVEALISFLSGGQWVSGEIKGVLLIPTVEPICRIFVLILCSLLLVFFVDFLGALASFPDFHHLFSCFRVVDHENAKLSRDVVAGGSVINRCHCFKLIENLLELAHFVVYSDVGHDVSRVDDQNIEAFEGTWLAVDSLHVIGSNVK